MPSKKQSEFEADVLTRIIRLEEVNAVLKQDACKLQLKLECISQEKEDDVQQLEHISAQLAEITESHSAVKFMWESMPNMMAEMRQKHDSLASGIKEMRDILNAIKSEQEIEERDARLGIEHERNDALTKLRDYIATSQKEIEGVQACFNEAMQTLRPTPEYAEVCRHCMWKWWEQPNRWDKSGAPYSKGWQPPRGDHRRTRNRCIKCDAVWDNPLRYSKTSNRYF